MGGAAIPDLNSESKATENTFISKQTGGTCYAHATAHAIIATECRIIGRNHFSPSIDHQLLCHKIIEKNGSNGANTYNVLRKECAARQLKCEILNNVNEAWNVVKEKNRVIVGSFYLNAGQWDKMGKFFEEKPDWVYESCDVGNGHDDQKNNGSHAVAIIGTGETYSHDSKKMIKYWKIKNSWGDGWADNGYFRLSIDFPFDRYIDVYFRICDLTKIDKNHFTIYNRAKNNIILPLKRKYPNSKNDFQDVTVAQLIHGIQTSQLQCNSKQLQQVNQLIKQWEKFNYWIQSSNLQHHKSAVRGMICQLVQDELGIPLMHKCQIFDYYNIFWNKISNKIIEN